MLAGLVAITAPCAFVAPWAASVIGIVAGFLVCYSVWFFDHVAHVDDPCGAVSVHGVCGAWGVLAVGLFADGTYGEGWNGIGGTVTGLFYGDVGQLGAQMFHIFVGFAWAWGLAWLIFTVAKRFMQIRVSPEVELQGLDVPEFGALCYPDFQLVSTEIGHAPRIEASGAMPSGEPGAPYVGVSPAPASVSSTDPTFDAGRPE
jgi:Amt family ammonium transporter